MATSKKAPASSKTAHVMNLLSKSNTPSEEVPETAQEEPQAAAAPSPAVAANKPPIIVSLSSEAAVSEQIRDALENALETDAEAAAQPEPDPAAQEPAAQPEPDPAAQEAAAQPEPDPAAQEPAAQPEPDPAAQEPAAQPEPDPAAQEPAAQPEPDPAAQEPAAQPEPDPAVAAVAKEVLPESAVPEMPAPLTAAAPESPIICVNIMQVLVDENADKYVKMFGLCQCPHCMADVKALALNNLQPKYVVMENGHVVPRISVYEGRYQAAVTAQILRACTTVMEQPRHDRPI